MHTTFSHALLFFVVRVHTQLLFDHCFFHAFTLFYPAWILGFITAGGEIGMVLFAVIGMARHESTVVVATYYISMTLLASIQGLCVFHINPFAKTVTALGFSVGLIMCVAGTIYLAVLRKKGGSGGGGGGAGGVAGIDGNGLIDSDHQVVRVLEDGIGESTTAVSGQAAAGEAGGGAGGVSPRNVCVEQMPQLITSPSSQPQPQMVRHTVG